MVDANTPFLLNPLYSRYELGIAQLDRKTVSHWSAYYAPKTQETWGSIFAVVLLVLLMLALRGAESKGEMIALGFEFTVKLIAVSVPILLAASFLNQFRPKVQQMRSIYNRLRRSRIIVDGELISVEWRGEDLHYYTRGFQEVTIPDYVVTAHYQFVSPSTGRVLTGWAQRERRDLKGVPLPPAGTCVRVLYADDEAHMML